MPVDKQLQVFSDL